jgi:hypothetical protein
MNASTCGAARTNLRLHATEKRCHRRSGTPEIAGHEWASGLITAEAKTSTDVGRYPTCLRPSGLSAYRVASVVRNADLGGEPERS